MPAMEVIIHGNMPYISARDIHKQLDKEADFKPWLKDLTITFDPIPGGEVVEIGDDGEKYFSIFFAGVLMFYELKRAEDRRKDLRRSIANKMHDLLSIIDFNKKKTHVSLYERNRIKIHDFIMNKKEVSRSEVSRRFYSLNKKERANILQDLVDTGAIEQRFITMNDSPKSTCYYFFNEEE